MSAVTFKQVSFANFLSFGQLKQVVRLDEPGTTYIVGENLDDGGSSGAGKTTIIAAVSYALYDKVPSKISKDKLFNKTNKDGKGAQMSVELELTVGADTWLIKRLRGHVTEARLFKNGKDETPESVAATNAKIEEVIGFSYNLFSQIVLFNGNSKPFLDLEAGDQRELIEELFKITLLTRKAEALKKTNTLNEQELKVQQALFEQQRAQQDKHAKRVAEAQARVDAWTGQQATLIAEQEQRLERAAKVNFTVEESLHKLLEDLSAELPALEAKHVAAKAARQAKALERSPRVTELAVARAHLSSKRAEKPKAEADIAVLQSKRNALDREQAPQLTQVALTKRDISAAKAELAKLQAELVHLAEQKCPYCSQKYDSAADKVAELREAVSDLESLQAEAEGQLRTMQAEIEVFELQQKADQSQLDFELDTARDALTAQRVALQAEVESIEQGIKAIEAEVAVFDEAVRLALLDCDAELGQANLALIALKAQVDEISSALTYKTYKEHVNALTTLETLAGRLIELQAQENPHIAALQAVKADVVIIDTAKVDELVKKKEHIAFLLKLLTNKDSFIRKGIISKTLPFLNKRIAYYTEKHGLPHVVLFQADLTCQITQHGRDLDHGNLSNGEKKRLNLSLCLAFRDALTYLHSKVNALFTDEVDGGSLDEQAVNMMIGVLKHKAWDDGIGIYIISHRPEFDGRCDRNLTVRKEGGFSTLIAQVE